MTIHEAVCTDNNTAPFTPRDHSLNKCEASVFVRRIIPVILKEDQPREILKRKPYKLSQYLNSQGFHEFAVLC